mgnify:CR=1 FL=1
MGGGSPWFTLIINAEGKVDYEGEFFVKKVGKHTWQLPPGRLNTLRQILAKNNFMGFQESNFDLTCSHELHLTMVDKFGKSKTIQTRIRESYLALVRQRMEREIRDCLLLDEWLLGEVYIYKVEEKTNGDFARHIVSAANRADAVKLINEQIYKDLNHPKTIDDFVFRKIGVATDDFSLEEEDSTADFFTFLGNGVAPKKITQNSSDFEEKRQPSPRVFYSSALPFQDPS